MTGAIATGFSSTFISGFISNWTNPACFWEKSIELFYKQCPIRTTFINSYNFKIIILRSQRWLCCLKMSIYCGIQRWYLTSWTSDVWMASWVFWCFLLSIYQFNFTELFIFSIINSLLFFFHYINHERPFWKLFAWRASRRKTNKKWGLHEFLSFTLMPNKNITFADYDLPPRLLLITHNIVARAACYRWLFWMFLRWIEDCILFKLTPRQTLLRSVQKILLFEISRSPCHSHIKWHHD